MDFNDIFSISILFAPYLFQTHKFSLIRIIKSLVFIPQSETPVIGVGWTLSYEMYFYLLFSIGLSLKGHRAPLFVSIFLLISVISGILLPETDSPIIELMTSPLLIEFIFGIILCYAFILGVRFSLLQSLIFILIGIASFLIFYGNERLISYGIPWIFIFIGIVFSSSNLLESKQLIFLGNASYSIYLVHAFTLPALHFIMRNYLIENDIRPVLYLILYPLYYLSGVLSGVACFILIERPLTNQLKLITNSRIRHNQTAPVDVNHRCIMSDKDILKK